MIVTNDYKFNSNISEVIKTVLNTFFFLQKDFTSTKEHKTAYNKQKSKNVYKKHLREKKSLIRLFTICAFAWLCFYAFSAFSAFSACKIFSSKIKSLNGSKKLVFVSSRQLSFLTGPNKLDFVRMYVSTFTSLVGPPYITLWGLFYFF